MDRQRPAIIIGAAVALVLCPSAASVGLAYAPGDAPANGAESVEDPTAASRSPIDGRPHLPKSPIAPIEAAPGGTDDEGEPDHDHGTDATGMPSPAAATLDDVRRGEDGLPPAVARTRRLLLAAARTGDIEALREVFSRQRGAPIVASYEAVDDPIDHLRRQSGDAEGREILAILLELLESGHVRVGEDGAGTYVWPYFAEVPLEALSDEHYVELYRILTAIDVEELERIGRYTFFRVGIAHDGRVRYFTAGDLE